MDRSECPMKPSFLLFMALAACKHGSLPPPAAPSISEIPTRVHVELSCEDLDTAASQVFEVKLATGEALELRLCAQPTSGFEWVSAAADAGRTTRTEWQFMASSDGQRVGAPGWREAVYDIVGSEETSIELTYGRQWEVGEVVTTVLVRISFVD